MTDAEQLQRARAAAAGVEDPELPPLTIEDLGILRSVRMDNGIVEVAISPTYSGCPAMTEIGVAIRAAVLAAGIAHVRIKHVLAPAWTTDWLTQAARQKLLDIGIAPPEPGAGPETFFGHTDPACPRCQSADTERLGAFGSTACKSLHRCRRCAEPFEAFKCH